MSPSHTGGAVVTGYRIEVSFDDDTSWSPLVENTENTATTYAHTGLASSMTCYYRVSAINSAGTGPVSKTVHATTDTNVRVTEESGRPQSIMLLGNYPNPSSERTNILFDLPESAKVSIIVTDLLGRTVISTYERSFSPGKKHTLEINTSGLSTGIYNYTMVMVMQNRTVMRSKSMVLIQ